MAADHQDMLRRVTSWATKFITGEDPVERGTHATYTPRLSRERYSELVEELDDVIAAYRDDQEAEGTLTWRLSVMGASEEI